MTKSEMLEAAEWNARYDALLAKEEDACNAVRDHKDSCKHWSTRAFPSDTYDEAFERCEWCGRCVDAAEAAEEDGA